MAAGRACREGGRDNRLLISMELVTRSYNASDPPSTLDMTCTSCMKRSRETPVACLTRGAWWLCARLHRACDGGGEGGRSEVQMNNMHVGGLGYV